jgi:hypothetical protein
MRLQAISPAPLAGVMIGQLSMNSGAERQGAIRNRDRAESGAKEVSNFAPTQLPRGYGCYCADQNAVAFPGGTTPPEGPDRQKPDRARKGSGTAGSERARQIPRKLLNWAVCKSTSPNCKANAA